MPRNLTIIALSSLLLISACSSPSKSNGGGVIVDTNGVDMSHYDTDLSDCVDYSQQVNKGAQTAEGAAGGAVVGGVIGAVFNGSRGAELGAASGAVAGGARGLSKASEEEKRVVKNCMRGRGYRVLN